MNELGFVRKTPLVFAPALNCWLKLESLQPTGSFKIRGAALKLSRLRGTAPAVIAASAGGHGMAVALAAQKLGLRATVVVPTGAAAVKKQGIAQLGAELIEHGAGYVEAEAHALHLAATRGQPFISPFDDEDIIEGNGAWLARELVAQHAGLRRVVVPVGGGGLIAGCAQALGSDVDLWGVEPRGNCAMHASLAAGRALLDYAGAATLCDGLEGTVGERPFALTRARGVSMALVDEEAILRAVGFAFRALGLVMEPSAAVCVAAARAGAVPVDEETVIVVSGSNIDDALLDRGIRAHDGVAT
jgi:threonine dehydratase